jgi:hypothetical protein
MNDEPGLTSHRNITALVATYELTKQRIIDAVALLAAAEKDWDGAFALGNGIGHLRIRLNGRHSHHYVDTSPESIHEALTLLKRDTWSALVDRLELRRLMSIERWKQLQKELESGDLPEITVETVLAWGKQQIAALPTMLQEAVNEVFEWLRPRNTRYARNSEFEVPRRIALTGIARLWFSDRFSVDEHYRQHLIALESVFNALDGRGQIAKHHKSLLQVAIEERTLKDKRGETDLFEFTVHKNSSLHLTFKRVDLLERFNRMAGGKRLRGTEAA